MTVVDWLWYRVELFSLKCASFVFHIAFQAGDKDEAPDCLVDQTSGAKPKEQ